MKAQRSRKPDWPRKITLGRVSVSIYKRTAPNGSTCFMVANYSTGKRRFDSYAEESEAIEAAAVLARRMSTQNTNAAMMTKRQADEWATVTEILKPLGISLTDAVSRFAEAFKIAGDVVAAAKFSAARHKKTTAKRVADVIAEMIAVKEGRGASKRYLDDLRVRLNRFADAMQRDACNVTTADIQSWLDSQKKLAPQSYKNFRTVLYSLFEFAVARGYASDNPVEGTERVKVNGHDVAVYSPLEIAKLLAAASPEFLPSIVLGAFAGLRSAEIERLEWSDIHLAERHVVIGASRAKTASRRLAPLSENAVAWLTPYAGSQGKVWTGSHDDFYDAQQATAKAAGVTWKQNALRHSAASYMFALSNDAGRVAGFLGNSAAVIHKHYRQLVTQSAAVDWFNVRPDATPALPANVLPMLTAATNS